jgi:hypothetical protein
MGMVFGIQREEEPSYTVLLDRTLAAASSSNRGTVHTPYEIRQYGTRYAIEAAFDDPSSPGDNPEENTRSPFMKLAGYIGVMSDPQNESREGIAMTAPVAMQRDSGDDGGDDKKKGGEKIAMTAPVAMHRDNKDASSDGGTTKKKMQFFLPSKYDSLDKIPTPTNPDVTIAEVPPAVGAVHRYSGTFSEAKSRKKAKALVEALQADGATVDVDRAMKEYQFWGYNPPFTIPIFRRNEVWIELSEEQIDMLKKKLEVAGDAETK